MGTIAVTHAFLDDGNIHANKTIHWNEEGIITNISETSKDETIISEGLLIPGFVNAHGHIELSHLQNVYTPQLGMIGFLENISSRPEYDIIEKEMAMESAVQRMKERGIVYCGDISNDDSSLVIKKKYPDFFFSFIEMLGVEPLNHNLQWEHSYKTYKNFESNNLECSISPHAPYSCNFELMNQWNEYDAAGTLFTMHFLESKFEFDFFSNPMNLLRNFVKRFLQNKDIDTIPCYNKDVIETFIPLIDADKKIMLVHNTYLMQEYLQKLNNHLSNFWLCTCPNANLFIENNLPNYFEWESHWDKVLIGTDSLASNLDLCILSELKTIKSKYKIPIETLLKWATINGANFFEKKYLGSITNGKKPGLSLLTGDWQNLYNPVELNVVT